MEMIIVVVLAALSAGAFAMVFLDHLADKKNEKRINLAVGSHKAEIVRTSLRNRKKTLEEALQADNETDKDAKEDKKSKLENAGIDLTPQQFFVNCLLFTIAVCIAFWYMFGPALGIMGLLTIFIFPPWYLKRRRQKRLDAFIEEFPGSIDVIVRGIKAGMPVADSMRIVATEGSSPVKEEFAAVLDETSVGITVAEAVAGIYKRVPLAEVNFFAVVISVQSQSGGNLSEALGNLSKVLRQRKLMRAKIKAMSAEAKSSAIIIGALPFVVIGLLKLSNPEYLDVLFNTLIGNIMLCVAAVLMGIGIFVMKKMVEFDF